MGGASSRREGLATEVMESIERLDGWTERNGWAGHDPYDIKGHPFFIRLIALEDPTLAIRAGRFAILEAAKTFPLVSRRLLRIDKQINAKGMGLFASAYLILHRQLAKDVYLEKARECLEWLGRNRSQGYAGDCWGYPFNWQSLMLIGRGTPSAVVSTICGDAFWTFYRLTGDRKYLSTCESICDFLVNSLNIDSISGDKICFSYTPIDRTRVHNANLFAAEFLTKVGKQSKREEFYQHGMKALNYTLGAQNEDGSFYYMASSDREASTIPTDSVRKIDHYHTGFVLRSLHSICKTTNDKTACDALSKGYQFYRDNLFEDGMIPRLHPDSVYPINIHSCAEAILCMSTVSDRFPDAMEYAQNAFRWTREKMQDKDGHFYYLRNKYRMDKTPHIRWGQAWMMRALASLLAEVERQE